MAVGAISSNVGGVSLGLGGECYGTVTAIGSVGLATGAWRIIPVSKWLITMVSKSPK